MVKIGITGGIGSGKSTVCEIWKQQGAKVINADDLAKQLMVTDDALKEQIIDKFGSDSYHKNGHLNRGFLAEQAFNQGRTEELEQLVHPAVFKETARLIQQAEKEGLNVLVYEAAILLQKGRPEKLDYIVLVLAEEATRIERVSDRDQTGKHDIRARIKAQRDYEPYVSSADVVIRNDGSLQALKREAVEVYKRLVN